MNLVNGKMMNELFKPHRALYLMILIDTLWHLNAPWGASRLGLALSTRVGTKERSAHQTVWIIPAQGQS